MWQFALAAIVAGVTVVDADLKARTEADCLTARAYVIEYVAGETFKARTVQRLAGVKFTITECAYIGATVKKGE